MSNGGITQPIDVGYIADKEKTKSGIDLLADTADSLKNSKDQLTLITGHIRVIQEAMRVLMSRVTDINVSLQATAKAVETIAEMAAKEIAEQDQTGQNEVEVQAENENS